MKKYNYFYFNTPITKKEFVSKAPIGWEEEADNGEYSFGGYRAVEI